MKSKKSIPESKVNVRNFKERCKSLYDISNASETGVDPTTAKGKGQGIVYNSSEEFAV